MTDVGTMDDSTITKFSHVRPGDTGWRTDGLRDFFMYRDLGVAVATQGAVLAQLVRANLAPSLMIGEGNQQVDRTSPIVP